MASEETFPQPQLQSPTIEADPWPTHQRAGIQQGLLQPYKSFFHIDCPGYTHTHPPSHTNFQILGRVSLSEAYVIMLFLPLNFQWLSVVVKIKSKILDMAYTISQGLALAYLAGLFPTLTFTPTTLAFSFPPVMFKIFSHLAHTTSLNSSPYDEGPQCSSCRIVGRWGPLGITVVGHSRGLRTALLYRQSTQKCFLVLTKGTARLIHVGLLPRACACTEFSLQRNLE